MAKGVSAAAIPAGAVAVKREVHDAIVTPQGGIEFFHGYTYSAHPLPPPSWRRWTSIDATTPGRARKLSGAFQEAAHSGRAARHRRGNIGLAGIQAGPARPARASEVFQKC